MTPFQQQQRQEKIAYWQPHIEQWCSSKIGTKQYCEQHKINHAQFKYWQYQLAPKTKHTMKSASSLTFSEAKITQANVSAGLDIQTPQGYRVSIPIHCNTQTLRDVLTLIKELSC